MLKDIITFKPVSAVSTFDFIDYAANYAAYKKSEDNNRGISLVYVPEVEILTFENFKKLLSKDNDYNNPLFYLPFERKRIVDDFLKYDFDLISILEF